MVLGLDISTSRIGIALLYNNKHICELTHIRLDRSNFNKVDPEYRFIPKGDAFMEKMIEIKEKYDKLAEIYGDEYKIEHIFIESPLKNAQKIQTVTLLWEFNGICAYILKHIFNFNPIRIDEYEARKTFLPEFCRIEKSRVDNPDFKKLIRKKIYKTPKSCNTLTRKYNYLKDKFPDLPKPIIEVDKEIYSYGDEIDIKIYIFEKVREIHKHIEDRMNIVYDRNNNIDVANYDMSDAYVVAYSGIVLYNVESNL